MNVHEVMKELESYASESTRKTFLRHGAPENIFGVKVQDLKKIVKKVKKDHDLSLALFDTKNGDAMYLAGLIADENKITKTQLKKWAKLSNWQMISEYTVPWVASESDHGFDLAMEWIDSNKESIASTGWSTLASIVTVQPDENIDKKVYKQLLHRAKEEMDNAPNRVKYTMNNFVIAVASYVESLSQTAIDIADEIGKVKVDMGDTACKVPLASAYIKKALDRGGIRKKRKTARC
ncbi:MAG: DNA alkylation repair protein [Saprospiraceae bacterium]|nr:DNA alkylation repair protein [Bacteroidia bacterium]NNE16187.1 DNA alkylation repair protein [Saprospiraceae bacterium]NNL92390.1 DNA alkylation repair protein [Saprospiraceae bacterium]